MGNKTILMFISVGCVPLMHADIVGDIKNGATALYNAANVHDEGNEKNKPATLDQIVPQIQSMLDELGNKQSDVAHAITQVNNVLSTIAPIPQEVQTNPNITSSLKQNLTNAINSLQAALSTPAGSSATAQKSPSAGSIADIIAKAKAQQGQAIGQINQQISGYNATAPTLAGSDILSILTAVQQVITDLVNAKTTIINNLQTKIDAVKKTVNNTGGTIEVGQNLPARMNILADDIAKALKLKGYVNTGAGYVKEAAGDVKQGVKNVISKL